MAGSQCAYLERALLDHAYGQVIWTPPATLYVAASLAPFDQNATGTAMNEVTGGGYARVALTNDLTNFPLASGSNPAAKAIAVDVVFPTSTTDWGTILSAYLVDALAPGTGNALSGSDAVSPLVQASGSALTIPAGTWNFTGQ